MPVPLMMYPLHEAGLCFTALQLRGNRDYNEFIKDLPDEIARWPRAALHRQDEFIHAEMQRLLVCQPRDDIAYLAQVQPGAVATNAADGFRLLKPFRSARAAKAVATV